MLTKEETKKLIKLGGCSGIIAVFLYLSAAIYMIISSGFHSLKEIGNDPLFMIAYFYVAGIGILGIVFFIGLYKLLSIDRLSIIVLLALIFGCIGFTFLTTMLMVQGTVMARMGIKFLSAAEESQEMISSIYSGLRSIDYGFDLVWDIFISLSVILFGISMIKSAYFGKIFGITGILIAVGLLGFNIITAPIPPASGNLIDLGSILFLWFLAVSIYMLRIVKGEKINKNLSNNEIYNF